MKKHPPSKWMAALGKVFGKPADVKEFVSQRSASMTAQLDGKSKGKELSGGLFGMGAQRGGLGGQLPKPILTAADADKDGKISHEEAIAALTQFFEKCDRDKKSVLDERTLAAGTNRLWLRPRGFWFMPVNNQPLPPTFGGGIQLAGHCFTKAGTKTNRMSLSDLLAFGEKRFRTADKNNDGFIDEKELIADLNSLPPVPAVFGPPAEPAVVKKPKQ